MQRHHERLHRRRREKGVPEAVAEKVWGQIQGFSGFGFPKAHSAAFGLLAYQSAWLRVHRAAGVPLRPAQRAADGLLPARRPRPRGAAPRRSAWPAPTPTAAASSATSSGSKASSPCGSASATSRACARRRWRASSPSASAAATTPGSPTSPRARGRVATASSASPGPGRSMISVSDAAGRRRVDLMPWSAARHRLPGRAAGRRFGRRGVRGPVCAMGRTCRWRCRWSRRGRRAGAARASGSG